MFVCAVAWNVSAQNLVPQPVSISRGEGTMMLDTYPRIESSSVELAPLARYLGDFLTGGRVDLTLDPVLELPVEGYRLKVTREGAHITGKDYNGVWNGIQTFLQLLPAPPVITIEDWPLMPYRGVMLDVARTFVPKEQVMRIIDNLARQKINKFHWHLTDNEGWRIEIKSYPLLTQVGAFRGGDSPIWAIYGEWDKKYGGFYTQDDIRQVVDFAAVRGVEIIPEIDLPGHSRAAALSYPEILCSYTPNLSASAGYDTRDVWCISREENYQMLDIIIGEIASLFPSPYIHIGGDEVNTHQWAKDPNCEGLTQAYFTNRLVAIAEKHGKTAAVWNEAAASGQIPKSTLVFGWENVTAARKAAANGYPTVICPGEYFYFDMRQSDSEPGHNWAGVVTTEKVYSFDPERINNIKENRTSSAAEEIYGVEATFFSELLLENETPSPASSAPASHSFVGIEAPLFTSVVMEHGLDFIDYQLFPRVCALAEIGWTPASRRSWADFERRMGLVDDAGKPADTTHPASGTHLARLAEMGIKYRGSKELMRREPEGKLLDVTPTTSITSQRAPIEGDWYLWTFEQPLICREIDVKTGRDHLQRTGFPKGRVEISYDGKNFTKIAELNDLKATVRPEKPVRAIRVVCESHGNGESSTQVQPLRVR